MHIDLKNYTSKHISIKSMQDLYDFVHAAEKVEGDVCCLRGRFSIDAKSIMGLMSIDIAAGFDCFYPIEAEEFGEFISKFEV